MSALRRPLLPIGPAPRADVPPFLAMDVLAEAARREASGQHVVHMEVGQPAAPTPAPAREAAIRALAEGRIGYTPALGIASLRERIAAWYGTRYGVALDPARVVVTTGSSGGFVLAFLALFSPGDRLAMASPGYPPYRHILKALDLEPVLIETGPATRYAITPDNLAEAHARTPLKGVIVASPANPTGTMTEPATLDRLVETAQALGIRFVSDEIYHGLTYAMPEHTALKGSDQAIVVNSFSKYFCMTGWRIGWLVVPETLVRPIERLSQNLTICAPMLSQVAAEAAFEATEALEAIRAGYAHNRAILTEGLPKVGLGRFLPADGAFYLYADISDLSNDSIAFAGRLLADAGVAATPGPDFDPKDGHRFLRFSYAGSAEDMQEAVGRIGAFIRRG